MKLLQNDLLNVFQWSIKRQLTINPAICEAIKVSSKRSPINIDYYIGFYPVSWSQKVKYLGVIINTKLKWNDQRQYLVNKATKCLNPLCRTVFGYTQDAKANSYRALVRACLEYVCAVWTPYTAHDINLFKIELHFGLNIIGIHLFYILHGTTAISSLKYFHLLHDNILKL